MKMPKKKRIYFFSFAAKEEKGAGDSFAFKALLQWFSTRVPWNNVRGAASYHFLWTFRPILESRGATKYLNKLTKGAAWQKRWLRNTALPHVVQYEQS